MNTCHVHCTGAHLSNVGALQGGKPTLFFNSSENHFLKSVKHLQFANNCRRQVGVFDEDRIARFGG